MLWHLFLTCNQAGAYSLADDLKLLISIQIGLVSNPKAVISHTSAPRDARAGAAGLGLAPLPLRLQPIAPRHQPSHLHQHPLPIFCER